MCLKRPASALKGLELVLLPARDPASTDGQARDFRRRAARAERGGAQRPLPSDARARRERARAGGGDVQRARGARRCGRATLPARLQARYAVCKSLKSLRDLSTVLDQSYVCGSRPVQLTSL